MRRQPARSETWPNEQAQGWKESPVGPLNAKTRPRASMLRAPKAKTPTGTFVHRSEHVPQSS
eukprot:6781076-Alexandrium_andersonii.AAC.1